MSTMTDRPEDLCTDAIPDPPRGQRKTLHEAAEKSGQEGPKTKVGQPPNDHSTDANADNESTKSNAYNEKMKTSNGQPPFGGFNYYPNGSIMISNTVGPIHIGNVNVTNVTQTVHTESQGMKVPRSSFIPETEQIRAMFNKTDLVTEKDLRYLKKYISITNFGDTADSLGYTDEQLQRFRFDQLNYGPEEIIFKVLLDWIRNTSITESGYDPTIGKLAKTLWDTGSQLAVHKWAGKVIR